MVLVFTLQMEQFAQGVAINNSNMPPNASSILDVSSEKRGMLIPRMASANRMSIPSPAKGLMVYDTTVSALFAFNGTGWDAMAKSLPQGAIVLGETAPYANIISGGYTQSGKVVFKLNEPSTIAIGGNSWLPVSEGRANGQVVQAGSKIAFWGGIRDLYLNTGAFYDPVTDEWDVILKTGAPSPRTNFAIIWTGTELVIWGGSTITGSYNYFNNGARYNPATKTWTPLNIVGAPLARTAMAYGYNAATNEMIIWGGFNGPTLADGARYNLTTNTWSTIASVGNPGTRINYAFTMGNDRLYIWGGLLLSTFAQTNTGYYYSFTSSTWSPMSVAVLNPTAREGANAVWTGSQLLIWGGNTGGNGLNTGARYTPGTNSWLAIANSPLINFGSTAVFANNYMFTYGINGGGIYNNTLNSWASLPTYSQPEGGRNSVLVSSASNIFTLWGGKKYGATGDYLPFFDNGGRFFINPANVTVNTETIKTYYLYKKD